MQPAIKRPQGLFVFLSCLLAASIPYTVNFYGSIIFFCALYGLVILNYRRIAGISGEYIKKWPGISIIIILGFISVLLLSALQSKDHYTLFDQLNNILSGVAVFILIIIREQDDQSLGYIIASFLASGVVCATTEVWRVARVGGVCGGAWNSNVFGGYLVTLIPLAFGGFFAARNWMARLSALAAFGLTSAALLLTLCRGSLAAVMLALLLLVWWLKKLWLLPITLLACGGILRYGAPSFLGRFIRLFRGAIDTSTQQRLVLWSVAWRLFKERPILGWGIGNYCLLAPGSDLYKTSVVVSRQSLNCHNSYLELLTEQGVLGLAVFILVWATVLWPIVRYLLTAKKKDIWLSAMTAGIAAFLLQNITNSLFLHSSISLSAWLLLGLCVNRFRNLVAAGTL